MNILFFGSSSFASQELTKSLDKNSKVFFFSRKKNKKKNFFHFDLKSTNKSLFKKIKKKKIDYLFFFSSHVPLREHLSDWNDCKEINVIGLINLIENLKCKINKIILASSCSVYGKNKDVLNEKTFLKPDNPYALSKFAQENILRIYCQNNNIKFLCYRFGYVYGKNMNKNRLVKKIILNLQNNKKIKLFNKNLNLNLVHTEDIKNIIMKTFKSANGIYNLTNKNQTKLKIFYLIAKDKEVKIKKINNNYTPQKLFSDFPHLRMNSFKKSVKKFKNDI